jgi:hypothetical protein
MAGALFEAGVLAAAGAAGATMTPDATGAAPGI